MSKDRVTLALVDDHPIVLEGLKSLFAELQDRYTILCFTDGTAILSHLQHDKVDIVLLDISLPDGSGIDVCRSIKVQYPQIIVIGLSNEAAQSTILQMLQSGASGFLLKDVPADELLLSVDKALDGDIVMSQEVKRILTTPTVPITRQLPSITKRERQVLQLLAQGNTTATIAQELFLSKLTIDTYRKNLLQKFGVKNVAELLMLLVEHKML